MSIQYTVGIRSHVLQNMGLLPLPPLDQDSRNPKYVTLFLPTLISANNVKQMRISQEGFTGGNTRQHQKNNTFAIE